MVIWSYGQRTHIRKYIVSFYSKQKDDATVSIWLHKFW